MLEKDYKGKYKYLRDIPHLHCDSDFRPFFVSEEW